jgi:hypothetical protein
MSFKITKIHSLFTFPALADEKGASPIASDKAKPVYDRFGLQKSYAEAHKKNPLKAKPLKIAYAATPEEREMISGVLKEWVKVSFYNGEIIFAEMAKAKEEEDYRRLEKEYDTFQAAVSIALQTSLELKGDCKIAYVVDENHQIQAISLSKGDFLKPEAWHIAYLLTAPHNIRGKINKQGQVEGAATALIEEAIVQAIKRNGLKPQSLPYESIIKVAVSVQAIFLSFDFYKHVYFSFLGDRSGEPTHILTGENLLLFLQKYGGRAYEADR